MGDEPLGKVSFDSQHIGRLIDVFLATDIAADSEGAVDSRARGHSVGLGKKNFMSVNKVAWNVVEVVFAHHYPAVRTVFPHRALS
jgi:hypothetical protein